MPLYGAARAKKASEDTAKAAVPFLNGSMAGPSPNASLYGSNTFDPVALGLTEWSDPIYGHGEEGQMVVDNVRRGWSKLSPDGKSIQYYDMDGNDLGVGQVGGGGGGWLNHAFSSVGNTINHAQQVLPMEDITKAAIIAMATAGAGNALGAGAGGATAGGYDAAYALEHGIADLGGGALAAGSGAAAGMAGGAAAGDVFAGMTAEQAVQAAAGGAGGGVLAGLTAGDIAKGVGLVGALTATKPDTTDIGSLITGAANLTDPYAGSATGGWDSEAPLLMDGIRQAQYRGNLGYNTLMDSARTQNALSNRMLGDYDRTVAPALRGFADYTNRIGSKDYIDQQRSNAIAGVQQASDAQQQQAIREMARRGVNPNDPRFASMLMQQANQVALNKVRAAADAESGAYANWSSALGALGGMGFKQLDAAKGFGDAAKGAITGANDLGQTGLKGLGAYSQLSNTARQTANNYTVGMRQADAGMANAATNATKVNNDSMNNWLGDVGKGVGWALDNQSKVKDAWNTLSNIWG